MAEHHEDKMRLPPQSLEAEQALLGAILTNNRAYEKVSEFLRPEHFANPAHAKIFAACQALLARGRLADPITIKDYFAHDNMLAEVGGQEYIFKLANASTTTINAGDYGAQIFDRYMRRELVGLGTDIVNDAFDISLENPSKKQIETAEQRLYRLANAGEVEGGPQPFSVGMNEAMRRAEDAMKNPNGMGGVPTDLVDLDKVTGGLHDSDLIIVAGRPGTGKTSFATCMAYNIAKRFAVENAKPNAKKKGVAFFSLEMSSEQLATRILSMVAEVNAIDIRNGKITADQFDVMAGTLSALNNLPLYVDETPGITVGAIRNRCRRLKSDSDKGLGLVVVDYLQLIQESGRTESRVLAVSEMTRELKIMAKELNVPVIVLSQLSRSVEQRENHLPQLADLRESGSIEQDADIVMFVYREIKYLEKNPPIQGLKENQEAYNKRCQEFEQKKIDVANKSEILIEKHRHGSTARVPLFFNDKFTQFKNWLKEEDFS